MAANPILARFDNAEILVSEGMETATAANLENAFAFLQRIAAAEQNGDFMGNDFWPEPDSWLARYRPYNVQDGVLMIPVTGTLLNDYAWTDKWATGYTYIRKAFERGMGDQYVRGIAFVINSGGGEVSGNFDLVDMIYDARGEKPIRAFAAEHAYSAAYSIASAADKITVARTGGVGSIGVVTSHVDYSQALEKAGIKVTFIHYGKHKVDGNAYQPLSDDAKSRIQARIDALGEVFVSTVARNRGMDAQAIRDTEALTYTASEATSNGLADAIGSLDDSVAAFAAELSNQRSNAMSGQTKTETAVDPAALETARAEGFATGKSEGVKEGANAERARISAIVASDEGKKRPNMALKMATGEKFAALDAETVVEMLGEMPEEKAEVVPEKENATGKNFTDAMDSGNNPDLGTPGDKDSAGTPSRAARAATMAFGPLKTKKA